MTRTPGSRQCELARTVRRSVVDDDNLVAVVRRVHRRPDAVHFLLEMLALVVDRQDDGHVEFGAGAGRDG